MTNTFHARIIIDRAAAVRAGLSQFGETVVPVDPSKLTVAQREELLRCPVYRTSSGAVDQADPYRAPRHLESKALSLPAVPDTSMASLAVLLDARPAAIAALQTTFDAAVEAAVQAALTADDELWNMSSEIPGAYDIDNWVKNAAMKDPRLKDRIEQRDARNRAARRAQREQEMREEAAAKALKEITADKRAAWIAQHGSHRLKRLVVEGIEHEAVYRDERLAIDRPGWAWYETLYPCTSVEPRNPPEAALDLLDGARIIEPAAKLIYVRLYRPAKDGEEGDADGDVLASRAYIATAKFMGRDIVMTQWLTI